MLIEEQRCGALGCVDTTFYLYEQNRKVICYFEERMCSWILNPNADAVQMSGKIIGCVTAFLAGMR